MAEIFSPLVKVCVVLSVVLVLIYLHQIVSGSPPVVPASTFVTWAVTPDVSPVRIAPSSYGILLCVPAAYWSM